MRIHIVRGRHILIKIRKYLNNNYPQVDFGKRGIITQTDCLSTSGVFLRDRIEPRRLAEGIRVSYFVSLKTIGKLQIYMICRNEILIFIE